MASVSVCGTEEAGSNPARDPKLLTIGILGGMGPEATADLYQRIIKIYQKRYKAKLDKDFPRIIINSIPIPDVVEKQESKNIILPYLREGIRNLEIAGANFVVVACNTAYSFLSDIQKTSSIPILNLVKEVVKRSKKYNKVGILATITTIKLKTFEEEFEKFYIKLIKPDKLSQEKITKIILNLMSGNKLLTDKNKIKTIIKKLKSQGAKAIILGCTELPLLINENSFNIKIFDTTEILAEMAVNVSRNYNFISRKPKVII